MRKHGRDNFAMRVIDTACSAEWLDRKEEQWIAALNTLVPNGYNVEPSSRGPVGIPWSPAMRRKRTLTWKRKTKATWVNPMKGRKHSPEALTRISEASKKLVRTPLHCKRIARALTGNERSPEHCRHISESKKGKPRRGVPLSAETKTKISSTRLRLGIGRGNKNHFFGKKHSPGTRAKMSAAWTPERKASLPRGEANPMFGRSLTPEHRRKLCIARARRVETQATREKRHLSLLRWWKARKLAGL